MYEALKRVMSVWTLPSQTPPTKSMQDDVNLHIGGVGKENQIQRLTTKTGVEAAASLNSLLIKDARRPAWPKSDVMPAFADHEATALIPFSFGFISQLLLGSYNMSISNISLLAAATDAGYFASLLPANSSTPAISLRAYHDDFYSLIGHEARARKVWDLPWEAFHEAGVYNRRDNSLYIASNYQSLEDNINITVVSLDSDDYPFYSTQFPNLAMANGGTTYYPPGSRHDETTTTPPMHVYCDEGDFEHDSKLLAVDPNTNRSKPLLTSFLGRGFSSLNDVRQHPQTGDLWFTDADYGYFQHFRPEPSQPKQVYRFEPDTGIVQVVADGFVQPNGLEFSPDLRTLYISDTGSQQFGREPTQPSTVYAYDVVDKRRLANRRTFAWADTGFPDGVHCDTRGNVWAACGDGLHIWNPRGVLLGKVHVGEMSNNFAFAPGKVFVFSNSRLWVVENIKAQGREVCRDFGVGCH